MKPLFITAGILLLIGLVLFGGACIINGGFSGEKAFDTKNVPVEENFSSISIDADTTDISFLPSTDEKCTVELFEKKKLPHMVSVKNDTLTVTKAEKKWYDYINFFNFSTPKITVYLPAAEYQRLSIKGSTGDISVSRNFKFDTLDIKLSTGKVMLEGIKANTIGITLSTGDTTLNEIECSGNIRIQSSTGDTSLRKTNSASISITASTGDISVSTVDCTGDISIKNSTGKSTLTDVRCENLITEASTGDLQMTSVIANKKFSIERDTGDVRFDRCDAAEILVETDTGNVSGTLLTDKIFITRTDTGTIRVPESTQGGKCKITTDTGNITVSILD